MRIDSSGRGELSIVVDDTAEMRRLTFPLREALGVVPDDEISAQTGIDGHDIEALAATIWKAAEGESVDQEVSLRSLSSLRQDAPDDGGTIRARHVDHTLTITLSARAQAERLASVLRVGPRTLSRVSFFVITGLAAARVEELAAAISSAAGSPGERSTAFALGPGVEAIENPARPRPRLPYLAAKYFDRDPSTRTPRERVERYRDEESDRAVTELTTQLEQLLADDPDEEALRAAWTREHRTWHPTDDGLTYRDWFTTVLEILRRA